MASKKAVAEKSSFSILRFYNTDSELEEKGAVMKLREDPTGQAFFLVRPFPNPDYNRRIAEAFQQHAEKFKEGGDDVDDLDRQLTAEALADTVLVGCGGMEEEYSQEFAVTCMKKDRIRERVLNFASNIANYRISDEDIEKK